MSPLAPLLLKGLFAIAGAKALQVSYERYARRRRHLSEAPDPREDLWWRILFAGLGTVLFVLVVGLILHGTVAMPDWAFNAAAVLLAAGVLAVFAAAFALGWLNASKRYGP